MKPCDRNQRVKGKEQAVEKLLNKKVIKVIKKPFNKKKQTRK